MWGFKVIQALKWKFHAGVRSIRQTYESRMGISADMEGEGEEEEAAESPGDASDDQRIIVKKEGRDGAARRYWATRVSAPVLMGTTQPATHTPTLLNIDNYWHH